MIKFSQEIISNREGQTKKKNLSKSIYILTLSNLICWLPISVLCR